MYILIRWETEVSIKSVLWGMTLWATANGGNLNLLLPQGSQCVISSTCLSICPFILWDVSFLRKHFFFLDERKQT